MIEEERELWEKIQSFELDDPTSSLTFSGRLARENGWKLEFALLAIEEYKKFMFLLCVSDHPLTPSDQVDQVWHLHLLYTESYWNEFCGEILKRPIHHGPTKGGKSEGDKFINYYEKTLEQYRHVFSTEPPADIWPSSEIRFGDIHFERVNLNKNWVIKKPSFLRK